MRYFRNALITGCGGDVACSLARIARRHSMFERLIGCDIRNEHEGLDFFDKCHTVPRANDTTYFERLAEIIHTEKIDLIVPTTDFELGAFLRAGHHNVFNGKTVLMASSGAVKVGLDKLETARFLSQCDFPHPWTVVASQDAPVDFPCIFKPRRGQGSKGLTIVKSKAELDALDPSGGVFQQYLDDDDSEFTSGLYRTKDGNIRHISLRRKLAGGLTACGVVVSNTTISSFLERLADALELSGSINIQFRLVDGVPHVFEINPRFSSTVRFRDRLGFQDFVWSVQERAGTTVSPWAPARPGIRIVRGLEQIIRS